MEHICKPRFFRLSVSLEHRNIRLQDRGAPFAKFLLVAASFRFWLVLVDGCNRTQPYIALASGDDCLGHDLCLFECTTGMKHVGLIGIDHICRIFAYDRM